VKDGQEDDVHRTIEFVPKQAAKAIILAVVTVVAVLCDVANAQHQGNSAYYSTQYTQNGSGIYVDASQFTSGDFCARIAAAINSIGGAPNGATVDARGINAGGTNGCHNSPWNGVSASYSIVLLLPAGTINISSTWVIPNSTRVVGEGSGVTTIKDAVGLNPMLSMGSSACSPCMGVSVEELTINGNNVAIQGILNQYSQEHSYVRNVTITNVQGTGLVVQANSTTNPVGSSGNSGPYENLYITAGGDNNSTTNECAEFGGTGKFAGPTATRGIHGMNCIGNGTAPVGIQLDTSNTTVENVRVSGFTTGIVVGDLAINQFPVQGDVLISIAAGQLGGFTMTNLIELSNAGNCTSVNPPACPSIETNTSDIDLFGVFNGSGGGIATNTINDQLTGTVVTKSQAVQVGMYVLGQPLNPAASLAQSSRFTTVPSYASWAVGATTAVMAGSSCTTLGTLYSNTLGANGGKNNLYACVATSSGHKWEDIK
jgi:hypothetical protein